MIPETWHFPAAWREEVDVRGEPWIFRAGLHWTFWAPKAARFRVEVLDEEPEA